jgi:hypothetical protein
MGHEPRRLVGDAKWAVDLVAYNSVEQEGVGDAEAPALITGLMDEGGAMLWSRVTYEVSRAIGRQLP